MNDLEIIAEIGVNHNGDFDTAVRLIHAARDAGASTCKFQLWKTERVYPPERWEEMKRLELSRDQIRELRDVCTLDGMRFLCTPDTYDDAVFLKQLGCERIKIGSSNITNERMLEAVAQFQLPIILSSGACELHELVRAVSIFKRVCVTLMHCVSAYPVPVDQANMAAVRTLMKRFQRSVGFSDHTIGSDCALLALGLGARTFEKHLTFDTLAVGPDHATSLTPAEFKNYVYTLRRGMRALGDGLKQVMPCEVQNRVEYDRFVRAQAC